MRGKKVCYVIMCVTHPICIKTLLNSPAAPESHYCPRQTSCEYGVKRNGYVCEILCESRQLRVIKTRGRIYLDTST